MPELLVCVTGLVIFNNTYALHRITPAFLCLACVCAQGLEQNV